MLKCDFEIYFSKNTLVSLFFFKDNIQIVMCDIVDYQTVHHGGFLNFMNTYCYMALKY